MAISSGFAGKETREPSCPATLPKGPGSLPREARRAATQEGFAVLEKRRRDRLMAIADADPRRWAIGFEDECWWSRVALPTLGTFSEEKKPDRLVQRSVAKDDPDPKAISCYGLYLPRLGDTWIRFVDGRPVSSITTRFLSWCCEELEAAGK